MHVSITALKLHSILQAPLFFWHAIPNIRQARLAPGNICTRVRNVAGIPHTLTVWENREAMRAFLGSAAHLAAMRASRKIGTTRSCGYEADREPAWEEALAYLAEHGRDY